MNKNLSTVFVTLLNRYAVIGEDIGTLINYLPQCPDSLQERMALLETVKCIVPNA